VNVYIENIYPLETALLGDPSDIDGDEAITILITPIVNRDLNVEVGDFRNDREMYTDSRNLLPFDPVANPLSNEQEILFVFAPDSQRNYNSPQTQLMTAAQYTNRVLKAWIAFGLEKLISYNQHVLLRDGSPEDDWIDDGLGAVMADLAGFNIWTRAHTISCARPQLNDIRQAEDIDTFLEQGRSISSCCTTCSRSSTATAPRTPTATASTTIWTSCARSWRAN